MWRECFRPLGVWFRIHRDSLVAPKMFEHDLIVLVQDQVIALTVHTALFVELEANVMVKPVLPNNRMQIPTKGVVVLCQMLGGHLVGIS